MMAMATAQPRPERTGFNHDPFVVVMFLSLLLLGGDRIAITVGGLTMRVVFPLLMTAGLLLYVRLKGRIAFNKPMCFLFMMLSAVGALSAINSYSAGKSIGYVIWVLFDFFVIISMCYNFAKLYQPDKVLSVWLLVFRVHALLLLAQLAYSILTHSFSRPSLWFYESSYMAIFMSGYFGSMLYLMLNDGRRHAPEFILSLISMMALSSATGIVGIFLALLLNLMVAKERVKLLIASVLVGGVFFGILHFYFSETPYYRLVAEFLLRPDISFMAILDRAGNRWIRLLAGWDAFQRNPILGIGIGGDTAYMAIQPFSEYASQFIRPWSGVEEGQPFCNIFVEVLGTMGIAGFIPFLGILIYSVYSMLRTMMSPHRFQPVAMVFFMGFFCTFLALQLEGTFLRYYLWAPLGLALGVMAQMREGPQANKHSSA